MEQYLIHTDYALWEVIMKGDVPVTIASISGGAEAAIPPKTTEQKIVRRNELKVKSTLLLAIPDEYLLKFYGIKDAKTLWEVIKTRFGGNKESKKIQKTILKQQYENFAASRSEGFDKTYDRFQKLISQLEIHGEAISQEDVNLKLLRSLPPAWNTHTLIMRNKSDVDTSNKEMTRLSWWPRVVIMVLGRLFGDIKAITELRQKFKKAEKERDDLKLTLEKFQDSSKNLRILLDSQQSDKSKTGLGYDSQGFDRNFMPPKPDLVFADEHVVSEFVTSVPGIVKSEVKTSETKLKNVSAPIIEDWVSDSEDENEIETESNQIKPSCTKVKFVKPTEYVKSPRKSVKRKESNRQTNYPRKNSQVLEGNPQYTLQDQGIFYSGYSRHMTGNKSFLTDYQEIDGGLVAFEHKFNLFSVSQMCDKKNNVLFTKTECLVLSPDFKLLDENQVLLKVPRQNNMYNFDLKNVALSGGFTCLFAKATKDEFNLWHRRLGHINFKTMNKLVWGILVRGIKREFSVARTPQQNRVAEKKNRTLIEAATTMLADLLLPTTFWAEAFNTACYVQNRVLVTKPHNNTPYELLIGRSQNIDFMRTFGRHVIILNTLDHLGKFGGKADEGFLVGYSVNSIRIHDNAGKAGQEKASDHEYILLPFMPSNSRLSSSTQSSNDKDADEVPDKGDEGVSERSGIDDQERTDSSTQDVNTAGPSINTANTNIHTGSLNINIVGSNDPSMSSLEETGIFDDVYDDREVGTEADINNLELLTVVSPIPITRVHKDHLKEQIIRDLNLATQTRRMINFSKENTMEVILNGDSPPLIRSVEGVETPYPPTTVEEKLAMRNELKARGILLMALANEHQLKFNSYKNAKSLMKAIEKRFGGNKESKKVQMILLKQQYKNFNGTSLEGLDQIYDKLQKLISQLEIHRETISQEDLNLKLLRSLPSEWKTHTLIWRNKPDLETLSMDDLYNNLKIYEAEVMGSSSTPQNTQNVAFVFSNNTDNTNKAVNTAHGDFAANSKTNASNLPNVNSKIARNLDVKGTDTIGFDKTKVEYYNCYRRGHFARECRATKHQDNINREEPRRTVPVEDTTLNALVSQCDRLGYDWSDQAEDGPTNFTLMAYTSSSSFSSDTESFLTDYQEFDGGYVAFGGSPKRAFPSVLSKQATMLCWSTDCRSVMMINIVAGQEKASDHEYILLRFMPSSTHSSNDKDADEVPGRGEESSRIDDQARTNSSTQDVNTVRLSINTTNTNINTEKYREVSAEVDTNNLELSTVVSLIPTIRVHKDHPKEQIIGDLNLATQTRRMLNSSKENA
nr:ribonuclease H-like domain-containing protein [Tanacetum cinerariifolium]